MEKTKYIQKVQHLPGDAFHSIFQKTMVYTISLGIQLSKCRIATIRYVSISVVHFMSTRITVETGHFLTEVTSSLTKREWYRG
jgi:hypothetical protein